MDVEEMPVGLRFLLSEGQHITDTFELHVLETGAVLGLRRMQGAEAFGHAKLGKRFSSRVVVRRDQEFDVPQHLLNVVKTVMGEIHGARTDEVDPFQEVA